MTPEEVIDVLETQADQHRFRIERLEQAVFALLADPENPASSAAQARVILTTPQG